MIAATDDGTYRLNVPVVNTEDDAALVEVVDTLCAEMADRFLDTALTVCAQKIEDLGFGHLMAQPHYVGLIGFGMVTSTLVRVCIENGILVKPKSPNPPFGYWAWYRAPRLMKAWDVGR